MIIAASAWLLAGLVAGTIYRRSRKTEPLERTLMALHVLNAGVGSALR